MGDGGGASRAPGPRFRAFASHGVCNLTLHPHKPTHTSQFTSEAGRMGRCMRILPRIRPLPQNERARDSGIAHPLITKEALRC
jgi:hypothetical protein